MLFGRKSVYWFSFWFLGLSQSIAQTWVLAQTLVQNPGANQILPTPGYQPGPVMNQNGLLPSAPTSTNIQGPSPFLPAPSTVGIPHRNRLSVLCGPNVSVAPGGAKGGRSSDSKTLQALACDESQPEDEGQSHPHLGPGHAGTQGDQR